VALSFSLTLIKNSKRAGFTLVEILAVVGITIILSTALVVYSSSARNQTTLAVEETKLSQLILRAKSLAVATYNQPPIPCGYGIRIDYLVHSYELFSYDFPADKMQCRSINIQGIDITGTAPGSVYRIFETHPLPTTLTWDTTVSNPLDFVFFLPPDPQTVLLPALGPGTSAGSIGLKLVNEPILKTIVVSKNGQLSFP